MKKKIVRQIVFVVAVLCAWQLAYRNGIFPKLMFPSIGDIGNALLDGFTHDKLGNMVLYSLWLLLRGMGLGMLLAMVFSGLSIASSWFSDIYNLLVSIFDLIPGVALIPLAILWFGVGEAPILFIVVHSVVWPMSRSIIDGFRSVPPILVESGRNLGLSKRQQVFQIYIPASFSSVLSGIKIGWARAWRGLISAEMIFGTTSFGAGIGWYIFYKRVNVDIAGVFAALIVIILIGVVVEYLVFSTIERHTVRKWGVSR